MKNKTSYVIAAMALTAVMTAGIGQAWAYFTTYAQAEGGYPIHLGDRTEITEEFSDWTKHVAVTSDPESAPAYVRVKAFSGSLYTLEYSSAVSGDWTPGDDGYYYYNKILNGGETTTGLNISIGGIPEDAEDGDTFNVVVIYESTPVRYDSAGAEYADWNALADTGRIDANGSGSVQGDNAGSGEGGGES